MQTRSKIFDDISQLMTNAMGVAQGARTEAETAVKGLVDRWLAERNLVTREEFEAVREMAVRAREENEALKARLDNLGCAIPTLYKQYSELCEPGGVQFIDFGSDPAFNNCVDGLVLVDLCYLKTNRYQRYIGVHSL